MLAPALSSFVSALVTADTPPKFTSAEAASAFSQAFSIFFQNASLGPIPLAGFANLPAALSPLQQLLIPAFEAKDAATVCQLMELAFLAYFAVGVPIWWAGIATTTTSVVPLGTILTPLMSTPEASCLAAKTKLANGLLTWLTTGPKIVLTAGGTGVFS